MPTSWVGLSKEVVADPVYLNSFLIGGYEFLMQNCELRHGTFFPTVRGKVHET